MDIDMSTSVQYISSFITVNALVTFVDPFSKIPGSPSTFPYKPLKLCTSTHSVSVRAKLPFELYLHNECGLLCRLFRAIDSTGPPTVTMALAIAEHWNIDIHQLVTDS